MEKIKVNIDTEYEREEVNIQDKNGNDVVILNWIPFSEKEELVQELMGMVIAGDEELGVCYDLMNYDLFHNYEMVKHYTNIDVSGIEDIEGFRKLYDYCQRTEITAYWDTNDFLASDLAVINGMIWKYREAIETLYEAEHSLGQIVKRMLNTDPDTNNTETRELIEKLIDMKGALLEKEEENKVLQFGKKSSNVKTGGATLNLAKR